MAIIFSAGAPSVTLSQRTITVLLQELMVNLHKYSVRSLCLLHRGSSMFMFYAIEQGTGTDNALTIVCYALASSICILKISCKLIKCFLGFCFTCKQAGL